MGRWVQVLNRFSNEWTNHSNVIDEKADKNIKLCLLLRHYSCQSLNFTKSESSAAHEVIHRKQINPPKSRQGESWLFQFNVHEEFRVMNLKPLCNLVCKKPSVDYARACCTHVHDQLLLPNEVCDETSHY
jgi:hypothetical protein